MKKVRTSDKKDQFLTHTNVKFVQLANGEEELTVNVTGTHVIPNRWTMEIEKNQPTSDSQITTESIRLDNDMGSDSFKNSAAASQTEINKYQETRILSPTTLKKKALEAIRRYEKKRIELLQEEID